MIDGDCQGPVAAGPVAERIGPQPALVGTAAIIALSVLGMLASRQIRTLEHLPKKAVGDSTPEAALSV